MKIYNNFQYNVDDFGTMVIYANDFNYSICEIQDCENISKEELDRLADEELTYLGLIKNDYFTASSNKVAEQNIVEGVSYNG